MDTILCEKSFDNQVWKIILNDPPGNVTDLKALAALQKIFDEAGAEKNCKLIVFR